LNRRLHDPKMGRPDCPGFPRARILRLPWKQAWSSAAAHCGAADSFGLLDLRWWCGLYSPAEWRRILQQPEDQAIVEQIRRGTWSGRPLGSDRFIAKMESILGRRLRTPRRGRPKLLKKSKLTKSRKKKE
jgi:putative transposase